jgi:hypothetical protein
MTNVSLTSKSYKAADSNFTDPEVTPTLELSLLNLWKLTGWKGVILLVAIFTSAFMAGYGASKSEILSRIIDLVNDVRGLFG